MNKYITDTIRNQCRCVTNYLTKPQTQCIHELVRGLFVSGNPILRKLAQDQNISIKKQAEKYSHHLGNIRLNENIDKFSLKRIKKQIRKNTIIAYDLTDANKEYAKKIENISKVFDGSRRKSANGFLIHGVGINNTLLKFEMHNNYTHTTNQIRRDIVKKISYELNRKGIWVFDRGNDHKAFFKYLHHSAKVKFIARLKENRQVVLKETGDIIQVKNLAPGKYKVYLMNHYNTKVDTRKIFTLVIYQHFEEKEPIRLLANLPFRQFSDKQLKDMYLERWGVENIFRRAKTKFGLENIRLLSFAKFQNLVSLIQLVVNIASFMFKNLQKTTDQFIAGILILYKLFTKRSGLTINSDSFISFLKSTLQPFVRRKHLPPNQLTLFSRRCLEKLGSF